jgi:hypothetical protein
MTDQLERVAAGYRVRIRYGKGQRQRYTMPLRSAVEAETRAATLRELAGMLTKAGRSAQAPVVLKKAAEATTQAVVDEVVAFARALCSERA